MPIVTISRGTLSGGEALAHCLSERLGYPAISREVIKDAASLYGVSESDISEQLEKEPKVIERILGEKRRLYLIAFQSALAEHALKGNFIYHGHAGHLLLRGVPNVFKVRLLAPLNYRVKKVMEKRNFTEAEAKKYIEDIDKKRIRWTKFLYDVDWTDPSLYDAVINLENITIDTACGMIVYSLNQDEFKETPEKRKSIENFALSCKVKAKLALNERTKGIELEVEADGGKVSIWGKLITTTGPFATGIRISQAEIMKIAQSVPGVKEVQIELEETPTAVE